MIRLLAPPNPTESPWTRRGARCKGFLGDFAGRIGLGIAPEIALAGALQDDFKPSATNPISGQIGRNAARFTTV